MKNLLDGIQNTLLLGAGPSGVAPSTYYALSRSTLGHLDPYFIKIMDELKDGLRTLMGTQNLLTVPMSGTGSIGMEASFVNLIEHGDKVLVLQNGVFGTRMVDVASRLGAEVTELKFEWGTPVVVDQVAEALKKDNYKIVAVVMAETSTGVSNPVAEIGQLLKGTDTLYLVDAVTSMGGMPMELDAWGVDVCYSGSQKCLSCPPGASPITFSDRAVQVLNNRKTRAQLVSGYVAAHQVLGGNTGSITTLRPSICSMACIRRCTTFLRRAPSRFMPGIRPPIPGWWPV